MTDSVPKSAADTVTNVRSGERNLDNQLVTLSKIFTERLFRIPDYQRGYAWTEKQLKEFWSDVQQLDPHRNHYTGVLTLESVPESIYSTWRDDTWIIVSKGYDPFFVVDGQQRLTTALILIQSILEVAGDEKKLNYTEIGDIRKKFIFDSKDDQISRSYIFGYEENNPSYGFLKARIFKDRVSGPVDDTVYTQNLERAKQFFTDRLSEMSLEDIQLVYRKITQNLLFNIFTISDDVDVCVAFETMNNRGKPLSYLELLKNRLIYLTTKIDDQPYEVSALRASINNAWRAIYHSLGRNRNRPLDDDHFLWTHYVIYFKKGSQGPRTTRAIRRSGAPAYAEELLEQLFTTKSVSKDTPENERVNKNTIHSYVSSLEDSIRTWYYMFNPLDSDYGERTRIWLDKIDRIDGNIYFPLILVFLQKVSEEPQQVAFLQAVERSLFLISLVERDFGGVFLSFGPDEQSPLDLAIKLSTGEISGDRVTRIINDTMNDFMKNRKFVEIVRDSFRSKDFYQWRIIRYFLFEYNVDLQHRSKTDRVKIYWPEYSERRMDFISVEHIYPQNARNDYWSARFNHLSPRRRAAFRNSLGNLLPLSKPKNSSLSNRPFPEKVEGRGESVVGYRYGSYAENEVAKIRDWTPDEIAKRGIRLLSFLERRWNVDLGDEGEKMQILGLDPSTESERAFDGDTLLKIQL